MGVPNPFDSFDKQKEEFGANKVFEAKKRQKSSHTLDDIAEMISALSANMTGYSKEFEALKQNTAALSNQVETHKREIGRMQSLQDDFMQKISAGVAESTNDCEMKINARVSDLRAKVDNHIKILQKEIADFKKVNEENTLKRMQKEIQKLKVSPGMATRAPEPRGEPGPYARRESAKDYLNQNLLVIGGFGRDTRKSIIEERMRRLAAQLQEQPIDIFVSRPRSSVGFMRFGDKQQMWKFKMGFNLASRPVVENDAMGNKLWSQISRPREERERTAALRKLVASLRGEMITTEYEDLEAYINYDKLIA
jgi:uncharacterized protein YoxC